jgi:hypothetical protein
MKNVDSFCTGVQFVNYSTNNSCARESHVHEFESNVFGLASQVRFGNLILVELGASANVVIRFVAARADHVC